jgi:hypothetical protein
MLESTADYLRGEAWSFGGFQKFGGALVRRVEPVLEPEEGEPGGERAPVFIPAGAGAFAIAARRDESLGNDS